MVDVVEGSLTYRGYDMAQGNKVLLDGSEGCNLLAQRFGAQTSGTIYGAALAGVEQGVPDFLNNCFLIRAVGAVFSGVQSVMLVK